MQLVLRVLRSAKPSRPWPVAPWPPRYDSVRPDARHGDPAALALALSASVEADVVVAVVVAPVETCDEAVAVVVLEPAGAGVVAGLDTELVLDCEPPQAPTASAAMIASAGQIKRARIY